MNTLFELLDHCPATNQQVVLEGVAIRAEPLRTMTAFFSCSHARRCEQEHGSLLDVPACRLHEVVSASRPAATPNKDSGLLYSALAKSSAVAVDPDIADLVPAFIRSRREEVNKLRVALVARDLSALDWLAQKMVGGGAMFGFPRITELGRALRKSVADRNMAELRQTITGYAEYLRDVRWQPCESVRT